MDAGPAWLLTKHINECAQRYRTSRTTTGKAPPPVSKTRTTAGKASSPASATVSHVLLQGVTT